MNSTWEFPTAPTRWYKHESVNEVRSFSLKRHQYNKEDRVGYPGNIYRMSEDKLAVREFGFYWSTDEDRFVVYDRPRGGNTQLTSVYLPNMWKHITRKQAMAFYVAWKIGGGG